jgi:hypothetical protein
MKYLLMHCFSYFFLLLHVFFIKVFMIKTKLIRESAYISLVKLC